MPSLSGLDLHFPKDAEHLFRFFLAIVVPLL